MQTSNLKTTERHADPTEIILPIFNLNHVVNIVHFGAFIENKRIALYSPRIALLRHNKITGMSNCVFLLLNVLRGSLKISGVMPPPKF